MFKDNPDFYPTPETLLRKMISHVDMQNVRTILEPSAGSGNIVEYLNKLYKSNNNYYRRSNKLDVDCIEQDDSLRLILQGKNFRVVHDNFLTYFSYKRYDLIIMNPPYSSGDKHLLKAIELQQRGGKIVCLLNADTLKNPYSNTRKELIKQLEKYDAEVEFIENAFAEAERKTGVSIALVSITIPKVPYNSTILNDLKREEVHKINEYESTQLIHSDFIEGIVQQYNYEVKAGLRLIDEYNSIRPFMLREFNKDTPILKLELDYKDNEGSSLENAYIQQIRSKYWKALFTNDQFIGLFTSNLKQKYMEMISELKDYDFSFYNIYSIRIQLSKEMIQGVEDTILNLFEEFSNKYHYYDEMSKNIHYFSGWKTNKSYKINARVIIPLNGFNNWWNGRFEPTDYRVIEKLKDIEHVFDYLDDGSTENIDLRETLIAAGKSGQTRKIELKYFYTTFYKKGTCHLKFKDMDLLSKFNLYAAKSKMWLPPSYGKVKYNSMSKEERDVIDQFEGEESYNKVMSNPSYYLVKTDELLRLTS